MRTAKRIFAEFMTVVMVLQACSPTVAAVAAGWQNISNEIAAASAKALDTAESGETNGDAANGSGASDAGAAGDSAEDGAAKDDAATGDTSDSAAGSDSTGDQTEGDDAAGDAAADDVEQDADAAVSKTLRPGPMRRLQISMSLPSCSRRTARKTSYAKTTGVESEALMSSRRRRSPSCLTPTLRFTMMRRSRLSSRAMRSSPSRLRTACLSRALAVMSIRLKAKSIDR